MGAAGTPRILGADHNPVNRTRRSLPPGPGVAFVRRASASAQNRRGSAEDIMPTPPATDAREPQPRPQSLTGHEVPAERYALIAAHVRMLSETALRVSDALPLEATSSDFTRVLETEGR
jgi:hypothetical protein